MKVKVHYSFDYNKYPKPRLVEMLHDRDQYIDQLRLDLAEAEDEIQFWKAKVAELELKNRGLRKRNSSEESDCGQDGGATNPKKPVMRLIEGPCFHGECWYKCPHCGKGVESYSLQNTGRPNIYLCPYCKNEVTDHC